MSSSQKVFATYFKARKTSNSQQKLQVYRATGCYKCDADGQIKVFEYKIPSPPLKI